jgi:hypothetical protein
MASLSTTSFISRSAAYVLANVNRVNTNGDKYLTKAEAEKLPADLRDNFQNHRGAQGNGQVLAEKFVDRYSKYVAVNARRADANGNGILSEADARRLPVDLQDNFRNAAAR